VDIGKEMGLLLVGEEEVAISRLHSLKNRDNRSNRRERSVSDNENY